MINNYKSKINYFLFASLTCIGFFLATFTFADAASLVLSPSTGVYGADTTFSVQVQVKTGGQSVNAAEGTLSYNPNELSVVSVNRNSSIFNLWVTEPTFSNSAGTINFSGGSPAGYSGGTGSIMTVTFRAKGSGAAKVNFNNGSVLANDGRGTNILTSMNGGSYTIQTIQTTPEPEVIEYIAPANTPGLPKIISETHPDPALWYAKKEAKLRWELPNDVVAIRTLLDDKATSIPTKVYDNPIGEISLSDLPEGISYFHLQFKNNEGWGKVVHYRLAVDTENPSKIEITQAENTDFSSPNQILTVKVTDITSAVSRFKVKIDTEEPFEYIDETGSSTIALPSLEPGYHTVIIEAFDAAGNSIVGTYSFTIASFDKPIFTEYPTQINEEVIPVIKGLTRPDSAVEVSINKIGSDSIIYELNSDNSGEFIFIPEGTLSQGVYQLTAVATDQYGAKSEVSDSIRIAVQQPGYVRIGSMLISVLSIIIPLSILLLFSVLGVWYSLAFAKRFRRKVNIESLEAMQILKQEFTKLQSTLRAQEAEMQESRRTKKLTKAETGMIEAMDKALQSSERRVEKEIADITELTKKKDN